MIIPNVQTYICDEEADRKYVIENIHNLGETNGCFKWLWNAYRSKSTKRATRICCKINTIQEIILHN
jgi:hypothetical protein